MRRMVRWARVGLPALLVLLYAAGCSAPEAPSGPGQAAPHHAASNQPGRPEVTMRRVNWTGFEETLKSLRGKVVVVEFWQDF